MYELDDYDFDLPEDLIAQSPVQPRDASRLMVVDRRLKTISHHLFLELPDILHPGDLLVANDSKVIRARLLGRRLLPEKKPGGQIEFLLLEPALDSQTPNTWEGLFRSAAQQKPGVQFEIPTTDGAGLVGELVRGAGSSQHGTVIARFNRDPLECGAGEIPLPPYIHRVAESDPKSEDDELYQTLHAQRLGSAAAPTAGLHFTPRVHQKLKERGISWETLTLHVGIGTFRPVKVQDIRSHPMHSERVEFLPEVADRLSAHKNAGHRLVAVGTTSVRALESAWDSQSLRFRSGAFRTDRFIYPGGVGFNVVDRLITNFHLPRSTLLMMVSAFAGVELIREAYAQAVSQKYRFFSYGDAMLIL